LRALAGVLLVVALLASLLAALAVVELRTVSGDRAMGLVTFFPLLGVRWLCLAVALAIVVRTTGFPWLGGSVGLRTSAVLAVHALAGLASISAVMLAAGPDSPAIKPWAIVFAIVMPVALLALLSVTLAGWAPPAPARTAWKLGLGLAALALLSGVAFMAGREYLTSRVQRASLEASRLEQERWFERQKARLAAIPPDAPLAELLPWLDGGHMELWQAAAEKIRVRPDLVAELAAMLQSEEAPRALKYLWLNMPERPPELEGPVHAALSALPAWADAWLVQREAAGPSAPGPGEEPQEYPPRREVDLDEAAQAAITVADGYSGSRLDFREPIERFEAVLESHRLPEDRFGEDPTYQPRAYLRTWLEQHPPRP